MFEFAFLGMLLCLGSADQISLADDALDLGYVQTAIKELEELYQNDPSDPDLNYHLALLYLEEFRYAEAIVLLNDLLNLDPFDDVARLDLATALWSKGLIFEAKKQLAILLDRHPNDELAIALETKLEQHQNGAPWNHNWQVRTALEIGTGYDNDLSLQLSGDTNSDPVEALFSQLALNLSFQHRARSMPIYFELEIENQRALTSVSPDADSYLPSSIGGFLMTQHETPWLKFSGHAGIYESFTDSFSSRSNVSANLGCDLTWLFKIPHELFMGLATTVISPHYDTSNGNAHTVLLNLGYRRLGDQIDIQTELSNELAFGNYELLSFTEEGRGEFFNSSLVTSINHYPLNTLRLTASMRFGIRVYEYSLTPLLETFFFGGGGFSWYALPWLSVDANFSWSRLTNHNNSEEINRILALLGLTVGWELLK
ncbi:MAG: tetratricopeptide repeat protein [Myxococcota bacterium]|nr:tetratricopeptide repeat protein [Myxococcota bacterium]